MEFNPIKKPVSENDFKDTGSTRLNNATASEAPAHSGQVSNDVTPYSPNAEGKPSKLGGRGTPAGV